VDERSDAGSIPASVKISHTVEGATHPEHEQLAVQPPITPTGILLGQAQHQDADQAHGAGGPGAWAESGQQRPVRRGEAQPLRAELAFQDGDLVP
jgi:hypothetical protein